MYWLSRYFGGGGSNSSFKPGSQNFSCIVTRSPCKCMLHCNKMKISILATHLTCVQIILYALPTMQAKTLSISLLAHIRHGLLDKYIVTIKCIYMYCIHVYVNCILLMIFFALISTLAIRFYAEHKGCLKVTPWLSGSAIFKCVCYDRIGEWVWHSSCTLLQFAAVSACTNIRYAM